jgi:hypothetical protein
MISYLSILYRFAFYREDIALELLYLAFSTELE